MRLSLAPIVIWAALFTIISASSVDAAGTPQTDSDTLDLSIESVETKGSQESISDIGYGKGNAPDERALRSKYYTKSRQGKGREQKVDRGRIRKGATHYRRIGKHLNSNREHHGCRKGKNLRKRDEIMPQKLPKFVEFSKNAKSTKLPRFRNIPRVPKKPLTIGPRTYIKIRADDSATVFLNGEILSTIYKKDRAKRIVVNLERKDVVGVKVKNSRGWGGILIDVFYNGRNHYSGISNRYKARPMFRSRGYGFRYWNTKRYTSCYWDGPKHRSGGPKRGFPRTSHYMWAKKATKRSTILVRLVVGGERCPPKRQKRPHRKPRPIKTHKAIKKAYSVGGHSCQIYLI